MSRIIDRREAALRTTLGAWVFTLIGLAIGFSGAKTIGRFIVTVAIIVGIVSMIRFMLAFFQQEE